MQQYRVKLTIVSSNKKTGPIPTTYTNRETCPNACPLKSSGCYAESGPVRLQWNKTQQEDTSMQWEEFTEQIRKLPKGQIWRHNVGGDLPSRNAETIDVEALAQLTAANRGRKGFTYTHYDPIGNICNRQIIAKANEAGFTINLSANGLDHADQLKALNIGPVVTIVPEDHPTHSTTPAGNPVIVCPAVRMDGMTCAVCKLCANATRSSIVAFPVHGTSKKKAARVIMLTKAG